MSVFPYPKYGEVNIMLHNFIVSGGSIFMTNEILCANIFSIFISETFLLFKYVTIQSIGF
ncbi:hypothetical protein VEE76_34160 [Escherichia coli]|nr:hypothetical protein VEE76_34160 [Escherichia coli]